MKGWMCLLLQAELDRLYASWYNQIHKIDAFQEVTQMKKLPVGIESFKQIQEDNYYYVDKTLLIKDIVNEGAAVTLFTRPRRFGKTLNMDTLK